MAFVLTPRFAPAYQASQCNPFGFCAPSSRPAYTYRVARPRPQRPQPSTFNHFFSQVDELLSEIDREARRQAYIEAQREAHRQRQQRKRALRATFAVNQNQEGWQIDGDLQGFNQENITIEVIDENTLKIAGNTRWGPEQNATESSEQEHIQNEQAEQEHEAEAISNPEQQPTAEAENNVEGVALNEPDFETITNADTVTAGAATPDSDTESHKSYQATVEDDFEDLGAENSSLVSSSSRPSTPTEPKEPKGKEKAVAVSTSPESAEPAATSQQEKVVDAQQDENTESQQEQIHGSFERSFRFPERIDGAKVNASFKDGALKIVVPKAQVIQPRRIAIL